MIQALACEGVHKAVCIDGATASIGVRQNCEALEAEPGVAEPAKHLVALCILCALTIQLLLADGHLTSRALLGPCLLDPPHQGLILAAALSLLAHALSTACLLASQALVVRLHAAPQARYLLADCTLESWDVTLLQ